MKGSKIDSSALRLEESGAWWLGLRGSWVLKRGPKARGREGALGIPTAFMDHPQGLQPLREGALNQLQKGSVTSLEVSRNTSP